MGIKFKQALHLNLRTRIVIISLSTGILGLFLFLFFTGYFTVGTQKEAQAPKLFLQDHSL